MKLPKWISLIHSPLINAFFSVEKIVSTISDAFLCEIPSFPVTEVASSFLVTFFGLIFHNNGWLILWLALSSTESLLDKHAQWQLLYSTRVKFIERESMDRSSRKRLKQLKAVPI